jgi:hypothetical protein
VKSARTAGWVQSHENEEGKLLKTIKKAKGMRLSWQVLREA